MMVEQRIKHDDEDSDLAVLMPTNEQAAEYLSAIARELVTVARQANSEVLVYLLRMVEAEACKIANRRSP